MGLEAAISIRGHACPRMLSLAALTAGEFSFGTSGENTIGTHTADRLMCHVLGVSPSGYYAWRSRPESARTVANRRLLAVVRRLHAQHRGRYGSPRIHAALRAEGDTVSCGWIERLMRRTAFAASLPAGSVP